jgi:hypothetical protein
MDNHQMLDGLTANNGTAFAAQINDASDVNIDDADMSPYPSHPIVPPEDEVAIIVEL